MIQSFLKYLYVNNTKHIVCTIWHECFIQSITSINVIQSPDPKSKIIMRSLKRKEYTGVIHA